MLTGPKTMLLSTQIMPIWKKLRAKPMGTAIDGYKLCHICKGSGLKNGDECPICQGWGLKKYGTGGVAGETTTL